MDHRLHGGARAPGCYGDARPGGVQHTEELGHARDAARLGLSLVEDLLLALVDDVGVYSLPGLARKIGDLLATRHSGLGVELGAVDRDARLLERLAVAEEVTLHRVHQDPVEVEDPGLPHRAAPVAARAGPWCITSRAAAIMPCTCGRTARSWAGAKGMGVSGI